MVVKPYQARSIWIGFDPREAVAFAVARASLKRHLTQPIPIGGVVLDQLRASGLYRRPIIHHDGKLWDEISNAPMATEFACSRFLVPRLAGSGLALFMDCDMLVRANVERLFDLADPAKAVMVVKHDHRPTSSTKMDGQVQISYARKNWSSVVLFNCDHPANSRLTLDVVNKERGLHLHQFCWLKDDEIGELPVEWNWLAGHSDPNVTPSIVHFTDGIPTMPGYENAPYAAEWRSDMVKWAS